MPRHTLIVEREYLDELDRETEIEVCLIALGYPPNTGREPDLEGQSDFEGEDAA